MIGGIAEDTPVGVKTIVLLLLKGQVVASG